MNTRPFSITKRHLKPWVMVTAYDTPTAEILESAGVELILVGDSVGMVMLGYPSTLSVSMNEMIHHAKAARRGVRKAKLLVDLPLEGIREGASQALRSAGRLLSETGCDAVKLEWGNKTREILDAFRRHRIPFAGHVGLTPQTFDAKRGFHVQGRTAVQAQVILQQALQFQSSGAGLIVLECIPTPVARLITRRLRIPTFGIGAGPSCDGQVLVFQDLVGLFTQFKPRHVKHYAEIRQLMQDAVASFAREVRTKKFPDATHSFLMDPKELLKFKKITEG